MNVVAICRRCGGRFITEEYTEIYIDCEVEHIGFCSDCEQEQERREAEREIRRQIAEQKREKREREKEEKRKQNTFFCTTCNKEEEKYTQAELPKVYYWQPDKPICEKCFDVLQAKYGAKFKYKDMIPYHRNTYTTGGARFTGQHYKTPSFHAFEPYDHY